MVELAGSDVDVVQQEGGTPELKESFSASFTLKLVALTNTASLVRFDLSPSLCFNGPEDSTGGVL